MGTGASKDASADSRATAARTPPVAPPPVITTSGKAGAGSIRGAGTPQSTTASVPLPIPSKVSSSGKGGGGGSGVGSGSGRDDSVGVSKSSGDGAGGGAGDGSGSRNPGGLPSTLSEADRDNRDPRKCRLSPADFVLLQTIGQGSFGTVMQVRCCRVHGPVCVTRLSPLRTGSSVGCLPDAQPFFFLLISLPLERHAWLVVSGRAIGRTAPAPCDRACMC